MWDILEIVKNLVFPIDFVVLDIEDDANVPLILGRAFSTTSRSLIDMEEEKWILKVGDNEVVFKFPSSSIDSSNI